MKIRGRLVPELDPLESRTCPSTAGIAFVPSAVLMPAALMAEPQIDPEASDTMTDSGAGMYDWVMMAMIPDEMMMMVNEYDQSAKTPTKAASGERPDDESPGRMSGSAPMAATSSGMPSSESEMPPAQMEMTPEPLIRPGSGSSRRMPMPERTEPAEETSESRDSSKGEMGEAPESDAPPRLSPGELDPSLEPNLESVPLDPFLENATEPIASGFSEPSE